MSWNGVLEIGSHPVPGYTLRQLRGRGAYGDVWEAEGPDGRRVALKLIRVTDAREAVREIRAIQAVSQLRSRRLIRIDSVWSPPGFVIVAMELADGSLLDVLHAYVEECGTPLPLTHLIPFLYQAAEGIDFLNTRQHAVDGSRVAFQHCDVKPNNLLFVDGRVKLADFGLTTQLTTASANRPRCGTPAYAAPEVFRGQLSDKTDQYALALTYLHLRLGYLPFADEPASFKPGSYREPDLSVVESRLERDVVAKALRQAPIDRWPSCHLLIKELERVVLPNRAVPESLTRTMNYDTLNDTISDG